MGHYLSSIFPQNSQSQSETSDKPKLSDIQQITWSVFLKLVKVME